MSCVCSETNCAMTVRTYLLRGGLGQGSGGRRQVCSVIRFRRTAPALLPRPRIDVSGGPHQDSRLLGVIEVGGSSGHEGDPAGVGDVPACVGPVAAEHAATRTE